MFWIEKYSDHLCSKNLTFPKAEHDQRFPRLAVVVFTYLFQSRALIGPLPVNNQFWPMIKTKKQKQQQPNVGIADHV